MQPQPLVQAKKGLMLTQKPEQEDSKARRQTNGAWHNIHAPEYI
jgi:hypothetical protein